MGAAEEERQNLVSGRPKIPTVHPNHVVFLQDVVEVLCGTREPKFRYEKQLRLCQFKIWVLGYGAGGPAVRNGGMIYAAAMISQKMQSLQKKYPDEPQSSLLRRTMTISSYRSLFDSAFIYPQTLYYLCRCSPFGSLLDDVLANKKHIRDLNDLTLWRLRIAKTSGLTTALNKAYNAYDAVRALEPEHKETDKLSRDTIRIEHRVRETREPFLFVAYNYNSQIIEFGSTSSRMLKLLNRQANEQEFFRAYFGRCQTVLSLLQIEKLSAGTLRSWSGANDVPLDDILSIPEDEQDWLGVKEVQRRTAAQTAKALRQKPIY